MERGKKTRSSWLQEDLRRIFSLVFGQSDQEEIRRKSSWFPAASRRPRKPSIAVMKSSRINF
jgi:hypothetical protein